MCSKLLRAFIISTLALATVNCERATTESSRVALQLPTYSKVDSLEACTKCLVAIVVNIDGDGFDTIRYFQKMDKISLSTSELNSEVVVEVPSGPKRKIQIMAIYKLASDSTMEMQYGSVVSDLIGAAPPPITVNLANLGTFKGGTIAGRYLTGANSGPTGRIIVNIKHLASGLDMDLMEGEMLDGWFNLFVSENFPTSYRFELGLPILGMQDISIDNLVPLSGGGSNNLARLHRPNHYYQTHDSGTTWQEINEYHDIVYGFFGIGSALKNICFEQASLSTFSNLSSNGVSADITYSTTLTTAGIYNIGGLNSSNALCFSPTPTQSYEQNRITIKKYQLDGRGNDSIAAMGGAFSYLTVSTFAKKYSISGSGPFNYIFKTLPNLLDITGTAMFDGVRLYEKVGATNGGFDNIKCNPVWLAVAGFSEVTTTVGALPMALAPVITAGSATISFQTPPPTANGYILCPTSGGFLKELGGFYVGTIQ